ncbi:MAG: LysR family transcriptional regulator [Lachnospiraceae bacterium]|nr:LysR family transcriptional regulator [Lachnospiraceae bacterium]
MISFNYYIVFYYVGTYKSFNKAAQQLGKNQPNVARIINLLEKELDCKLFERSSKGVALTPDGERLYHYVEAAFWNIRTAEAEMADRLKDSKENITLGVSVGLSANLMYEGILSIVDNYYQKFPNSRIKIINESTPGLIETVINGEVDMAIVTAFEHSSPKIFETVLCSYREILIAGPSFKELCDRPLSLSDLTRYPIIGVGHGTETFALYDQLFAANGLKYEPVIETATTDQVISFVAKNRGIGFISPTPAKARLKSGEILQLTSDFQAPVRKLSLVHSSERKSTIRAGILRDMFRNDLLSLLNLTP